MRTTISTRGQGEPTFIEAARRAQIIQAALETIAEFGFGGASLARMAQRAGISKGVIGYYFPSKDDLVRSALEHFYAAGHETMMASITSTTMPGAMLETYIRSNLDYIDKHRVETRAVGEILANFRRPDGALVYGIADTEPLIEGTAALFRWGQETGEFRTFDVRIMAVTLRAAVDAFGQRLDAFPDTAVAQYANELVELFTTATRKEGTNVANKRREASGPEG